MYVLVRRLDIFMVLSLGKEFLLKVPDNILGHRSVGKVLAQCTCLQIIVRKRSQTLKTILVYVVIWKLVQVT